MNKTCYKNDDDVEIYLKDKDILDLPTFKPWQNVQVNYNDDYLTVTILQDNSTPGFIIKNIKPNKGNDLILKLYCENNKNVTISPFIRSKKLINYTYEDNHLIIKDYINICSDDLYILCRKFKKYDTIIFYYNENYFKYFLNIYNIDHNKIFEKNIFYKSFRHIEEDIYSFAEGCKWDLFDTFKIDKNIFNQGYYYIEIINYKKSSYYCPLIIINNLYTNKILIVSNRFTWEAYNNYSEINEKCSFYNFTLDILSKYRDLEYTSNTLSLLRPNNYISDEINKFHKSKYKFDTFFKSQFFIGELYMIKWLQRENYNFDIITDLEIVESDIDLNKYDILVFHVHPEYIPIELYLKVTNFSFLDNKKLLNLSGNSFYWKINYNKDSKQMKITKNKKKNYYLTEGHYYSNFKEIGVLSPYEIFECHFSHIPKISCCFVLNQNHKITQNISINIGCVSLNNVVDKNNSGACGWETDTYVKKSENSILIGQASNPEIGGDIVIIERANNTKILTIGSISFTGSLLIDNDCSKLINNFINL